PCESTLTRLVLPALRSRTKTSLTAFVSPATRLLATESKATKRPSAEIAGRKVAPLPCAPCESTLTRLVLPVLRSRTKTSLTAFVSPATRLLADERKATKRPSGEIAGSLLPPLPCAPCESTLTRFVLGFCAAQTSPTSPATTSRARAVDSSLRVSIFAAACF